MGFGIDYTKHLNQNYKIWITLGIRNVLGSLIFEHLSKVCHNFNHFN